MQGFALGGELESKYTELLTNEEGSIWAVVPLPDDQKPYHELHVSVTPERRIYEVNLVTWPMPHSDRLDLQHKAAMVLDAKYGCRFQASDLDKESRKDGFIGIFGSSNTVTIWSSGDDLHLIYEDKLLALQDASRRGAIKRAKEANTVKAL